ncbi:MAG: PP2C family protein-serine/threonine phosphatase [Desulfovibrionaceae bacterium]
MKLVKLQRIIARREVKSLLEALSRALPGPFAVCDATGAVLFGQLPETPHHLPFTLQDTAMGSVCCDQADVATVGVVVLDVVRPLVASEQEKKAVVGEAMEKYREINMLYTFSEKIAAVRDPEEAGRLVVEKAREIIPADNGCIMLHNSRQGVMELLAWFGDKPSVHQLRNPGEGVQGRVMQTGRSEIVNDPEKHPFFVPGPNPLGTLICVPLSVQGKIIGVLNVSREARRDFRAEDQKLLTALASQAAVAIDNALLYARLEQAVHERTLRIFETMERMNSELAKAGAYVSTLLPDPIEDGPLRATWKFEPSASLGGDSFGYHWLDEDHFAIYLLDVSGHGMGAALFSVSVLNVLRTQTLSADYRQPAEVLAALNTAFPMERHNNMFFTIWYGVVHAPSRTLTFSSGGHHPALLFDGDRAEPQELITDNMFIGGLPDAVFAQDSVALPRKGRLYVFSDGVFEIRHPENPMLEFDAFVDQLRTPDGDGVLLDRLYDAAQRQYGSERLPDDFTILEFRMA